MKTAIHCRDCGAAVHVKFYGDASLPEGGEDSQRETAYMRAVESWWQAANDTARQCGYSGVTACGRSGGWCAPFNIGKGPGGQVFEDDENAPRFVAFAARVETLMKEAPQRFANELAEVIAEDEAADVAAKRAEREAAAAEKRRKLETRFCEGFRDDDLENAFNASTPIGEAYNALRAARPVSLLRIDAWRDGGEGGWTWNNWHKVASVPMSWADLSPRALLRELRAAGHIDGAGRLAVEDDGYNIVVMAKGTREPLLALAYGEAP